jgi:hypothetical protein
MNRDYQINKVYTAETNALPFFEDTMSFEEAQKEIHNILNSKYIKYLISKYDFIIEPAIDFFITSGDKRYKYARANNLFICLPDGTRNSATLLHEIAHTLTLYESANISPHGAEFCFVYLCLVKKFMGDDFYQSLKNEFDNEEVCYFVESD